jgi:hypothetical protein
VYPGANGAFLLYEDDGSSFDYRRANGWDSKWLGAMPGKPLRETGRRIESVEARLEVKLGNSTKRVTFDGKAIEVRF